ncbi:hypothetical protein TNCV_4299031 [Trichonephila clavipes]|nr:hypothetical protein TNCV_4299031 [Trichonephila clavipes]
MPSIGGYHLFGLASILSGLKSNVASVGYAWPTNCSRSTPFHLSTGTSEEPQYPRTSTFALLIPPATPSQNTEYDSSSDPSNAVMDMNDLKPTPKIARPLKETLAMFRKRAKTPTAPSTAARAASCIEEEYRMKIKYTWR